MKGFIDPIAEIMLLNDNDLWLSNENPDDNFPGLETPDYDFD